MIRHANPILISLFVHLTIFISILYGLTNVPKLKTPEEEKLCIKLCAVQQTAPEVQVAKAVEDEKPIQKKIEPKKEIQQEIKQDVVKPAPMPKKIEPKKVIVKEKKEPLETIETIKQAEAIVTNDTPALQKETTKVAQGVANTQKTAQKEVVSQEIKEEDEYLQEHLALIKKLLEENLYYPRSARKRAITGDVVVKFKLLSDATIAYIKVIKSPSELLSRGAVQTIENISAKFPKPKKDLILEVPISYKLSN
jgi:protein TonB